MNFTRQELESALQIRLNFFTQTGSKPDEPQVVKAMADYVADLLVWKDRSAGVPVGLTCFVRKQFGSEGKLLCGIRQGSHAEGCLSAPGGKLEFGESFEVGGKREIKEECGNMVVKFQPIQFPHGEVCTTNDPMLRWNKHFVTVWLRFDWVGGDPQNMEPNKCKGWEWMSFNEILDAMPREVVRAWELNETLDPLEHPQVQWLPLELLSRYRHLIGI